MRKITTISLIMFFMLFGAGAVFASSGFGLENTAVNAGYETTGASVTIASQVQTVVSVLLGFVATLFFGLTLYSGIMWMTARGKEDRVAKAKEILEAAIIGLAVVGSSYAIANFVLGRLGNTSAENGNMACCCSADSITPGPIPAENEQSCTTAKCSWQTGPCPTTQ